MTVIEEAQYAADRTGIPHYVVTVDGCSISGCHLDELREFAGNHYYVETLLPRKRGIGVWAFLLLNVAVWSLIIWAIAR